MLPSKFQSTFFSRNFVRCTIEQKTMLAQLMRLAPVSCSSEVFAGIGESRVTRVI